MFGRMRKLIAIAAVGVMILALPHIALALEDPVPREIKNLGIGAAMSSVMEMVNGSGTVSSDSPQEKRRPKITWTLSENPYYKNIEFNFTEKDRLFLIRYNFKEGRREEFQGLKKAFFELYKFSWEEPMRFKVKDSDVLLYQPEKGNLFFLEFTDKRTGTKSIELFDKSVSAQDRAAKKPEDSGGKTTPDTGKESQSIGAQDKQVGPQDDSRKKLDEAPQQSGERGPESERGNEPTAK